MRSSEATDTSNEKRFAGFAVYGLHAVFDATPGSAGDWQIAGSPVCHGSCFKNRGMCFFGVADQDKWPQVWGCSARESDNIAFRKAVSPETSGYPLSFAAAS